MAFELTAQLRPDDRLTLVGQGPAYRFVPSNPWVAIGWRQPEDITVDLTSVTRRKNIRFLTMGARRVHPTEKRVELEDGQSLAYDHLVIATGPDLAFDEIAGFGPQAHTHSVCQTGHAEKARAAFEAFCR